MPVIQHSSLCSERTNIKHKPHKQIQRPIVLMESSSSQLPKLLKMQTGTGNEAWSLVRALSDLNRACVYNKESLLYALPRQAVCGGGKKPSRSKPGKKRGGGHMMVLSYDIPEEEKKAETGISLCLEASLSPQRQGSNFLINVSE